MLTGSDSEPKIFQKKQLGMNFLIFVSLFDVGEWNFKQRFFLAY